MTDEKIFKIDGERFSAYLDNKGNIQKISFLEKVFEPPMKYTLYELNGEIADVSEMPSNKELSLKLTTKDVSGRLTLSSGKEIKMHLEPDRNDTAKNVGLVLPFPLKTEFHLPEINNLGRKIEDDMPTSEWYRTSLSYNFFLANYNDVWIRFMTKQPRLRSTDVHISRHPEVFIVTFTWNVADDAFISLFPSMDEAIKDYEAWLEKELGVRKLRDRPNLPEWIHNVKLVLIIDMLRSHWEIAHDYNDLINLANDLKKTGCPQNTLFYIPGWNGAYDSTYPTYKPHPDLGGEEKFREMMETLHKNGFRVMIHTNAWGLDPCHTNIDEYEKYVSKNENGIYIGWQTSARRPGGGTAPPSRPLKFRSDKVMFHARKGVKSFAFETLYVPEMCEALLSVGNLKIGDARVKFTIDRRSMLIPPGWFKDHDEYIFPAPFLLRTGQNKVLVEVMGEVKPDWKESWYKIRYCFLPLNPYLSFTYPILRADVSNHEWIEIFVNELATSVRKYQIDAIHVDATGYDGAKRLLDTLKERLPDVPIGTENFGSLWGMGYSTFSQNAGQSLIGYLDLMRGTCQQSSIPDRSGIEELYSWLNKPSPVTNFVKDYIYLYAHLCAADAFVPMGKVCQTFPSRLSPRCQMELWKVLRDARRLNYIPTLRLNYRKFGLDDETKKAIQEIASGK